MIWAWIESLPPRRQAAVVFGFLGLLVLIGAVVGDPAVIGDRLLD